MKSNVFSKLQLCSSPHLFTLGLSEVAVGDFGEIIML